MDITGKIIVALPEQGGTTKAGNAWKKREYVLETLETYPKKVFFNLFGDRADKYPLQVGQTVKLYYDIESREYNGRWYTDIRGWQVEQVTDGAGAAAPQAQQPQQTYTNPGNVVPPPPVMEPSKAEDDLPF